MALAPEGGLKDTFATFFEDPSRDNFRELLKGHLGETKNLDFKAEWPKPGSLAKHILAMGNSGGGCIIIGITEREDKTAEATGVQAFMDKADVTSALKTRLPESLAKDVSVWDFAYERSDYEALAGKRFQVVFIKPNVDHVPFIADRSGEGLRSGAIYIRHEGMSEEASYSEVQRLINARVLAGVSTAAEMELKHHLDQLEALYERLLCVGIEGGLGAAMAGSALGEEVQNLRSLMPCMNEDLRAFIVRMIDAKKRRIEKDLKL